MAGELTEDQEIVTGLRLPDGHNPTDVGNADRLVALASGTIRYVETWGTWIVYDDDAGHWVKDTTKARVSEKAKQVAEALWADALRIRNNKDVTSAVRDWAKKCESSKMIHDMIGLARGVPGVVISHEEIDARPHLLNVRNGTVDLRDGSLQCHSPEDLLMLQAPVFFQPDARGELWDRCLRMWQPNDETRDYLQRICGTSVSGEAVQNLFINVGTGANGKSVCFEAISAVLGPFKIEPHKRLLIVNRHEGHATELASLKGVRMAVASETSDHERLNEASIKNLTGGDTLRARGVRENEWSFKPTHTLFLHTNYQPDIKGTDEGIWRRIRIIPWGYTIPADQRNDHLLSELTSEEGKSAILNWLIAGYLRYLNQGQNLPEEVQRATDAYRQDEDTLGVFIGQRVKQVTGRQVSTPNGAVLQALNAFCEDRGDFPPTSAEVTKRLLASGFKSKRKTAGIVWLQLRLNEESAPEQDVHVQHVGLPSDVLETTSGESTGSPTSPTSNVSLQEFLADLMANYGHIVEAARRGESIVQFDEEEWSSDQT